MTTEEIKYLDGEFIVNEETPNTVAEVVALIGEPATVDAAVDDLRYRNKYPRVYREVSEKLEKEHGFPRIVVSTKTLKDKSVKHVHESHMDHIRAFHTGRPEVTLPDGTVSPAVPAPDNSTATLQTLFTSIGQAAPLYIKGERTGSQGKVAEGYVTAANAIFAKGDDVVETTVEKIEAALPGFKVVRDSDKAVTPDALARGLQNMVKAKQAEAQRAAMAEIAV